MVHGHEAGHDHFGCCRPRVAEPLEKAGERDCEMHQTKKGSQWCYGKIYNSLAETDGYGVYQNSGLIHSVVNADAGYHGIEKRAEMEGRSTKSRVAMRPDKRPTRALIGVPMGH